MTKKILTVLLCGFFLCNFSALAYDESTSMESIHEKTGFFMNKIEKEWNQEIVRVEYDILQTEKTTFRQLSQGWTYNIIAYGDDRFEDIDIVVYKWINNNWKVVDKDNDNESSAVVQITPNSTGDYKIVIKAYKFKKGYSAGHYGLIICHEQK